MPRDATGSGRSRRQSILRGVALLLLGLVWVGVGGGGGQLVGKLADVASNDQSSFLPGDAESTRVIELSRGFADDSSLPFFALMEAPSQLDASQQDTVARWAASVPDLVVPGSEGAAVQEYLSSGSEQALSAPGGRSVLPSEDGRAALVVVALDAEMAQEELPNGDSVVFGVAQALRASLSEAVAGEELTAAVGGPAGVLADLVTAFSGIDGRLLQVTLIVVFVILLLVYRSPVLPLVALLSSVFALGAAGAAVYPLAKNGVLDLNGQSQGILLILTVGAATDYALLLIARYREELHDHQKASAALWTAWKASFEPILASGATVILGLLCLLLSDLGSTRGLGPVGALGIAAAMASVLTFLPLLLLAGRWLFWPRMPRLDHRHAVDRTDATGALTGGGLWARVGRLVGAHPRAVWVLTLTVLLGAAAFAPTFQAEGTSQTDTFRNPVDSVAASDLLEKHFSGGAGDPTIVLTPAGRLGPVVDLAGSVEGVASVSVTPEVPSVPGGPTPGAEGTADPEPKVVGGLAQVQVVLEPKADSPAGEDVVERLRTELDEVGEGVLVGGNTAVNLDIKAASARDLIVIIPAVLVVILLVLILLLRSLVAPVLLVLANVVSFGATIGICAVIFNHVLDMPGSDPGIPLYGFVFLVALGIDYSIFLMTRVREESGRRGTRPGILVGLAVTGGVITSAGVVLASTFGALGSIPLLFLVQVAFVVAIGVLIDTLVVRSLLVPALSYDIGPRIWWPSALGRSSALDRSSALGREQVGQDQTPGSSRGLIRSSTAEAGAPATGASRVTR